MSNASATTASPPTRFKRQATGTDTVTIACSLPNGLRLVIYTIEESTQFYPNGREFKENVATINEAAGFYDLHGSAIDMGALAAGEFPDYRVIKGKAPGTGYALTSGIPRDFAEEWFRQNANSPLVKPRVGMEPIVFMASTETRAVSESREYKNGKSGFQGLDQSGDYRVPRGGRDIRKYNPNDNRTSPEQSDLSDAAE
jgi:hypothetical protein